MRPVLTTVVWCVAAISCATAIHSEEEAVQVSLVQLIATPERFEGRRVEFKGFCIWQFEQQAVYLHREDAEVINTANAVWLRADLDRYKAVDGQFVFVSGLFTARQHGHLGAFPGVIREITQLERTPTLAELERRAGRTRPD